MHDIYQIRNIICYIYINININMVLYCYIYIKFCLRKTAYSYLSLYIQVFTFLNTFLYLKLLYITYLFFSSLKKYFLFLQLNLTIVTSSSFGNVISCTFAGSTYRHFDQSSHWFCGLIPSHEQASMPSIFLNFITISFIVSPF